MRFILAAATLAIGIFGIGDYDTTLNVEDFSTELERDDKNSTGNQNRLQDLFDVKDDKASESTLSRQFMKMEEEDENRKLYEHAIKRIETHYQSKEFSQQIEKTKEENKKAIDEMRNLVEEYSKNPKEFMLKKVDQLGEQFQEILSKAPVEVSEEEEERSEQDKAAEEAKNLLSELYPKMLEALKKEINDAELPTEEDLTNGMNELTKYLGEDVAQMEKLQTKQFPSYEENQENLKKLEEQMQKEADKAKNMMIKNLEKERDMPVKKYQDAQKDNLQKLQDAWNMSDEEFKQLNLVAQDKPSEEEYNFAIRMITGALTPEDEAKIEEEQQKMVKMFEDLMAKANLEIQELD